MNNKNENFKTLTSNESKGKVKKVKETCNIRGKLLEKGWKTTASEGQGIFHSLKALYYVKV